MRLGGIAVCLEKLEDGRVGIFHADTPALHGGDAIDEPVILALG